MANYNLVVNSKFKPFSFGEIAKPYLMYKQEYDTQQAALGELATKASVWENIANEQTDPVAYARYKAYSDNLKNQADILATQGLNAGTKQALMNLRSDYATRITPIEQAFTTRQKQAEQQQQALLQDDSLLFNRMAATTSLDDYMANPQLQYDVKSGNKLTARVAAAAQNLAKEFRENPEKMIPLVGKDYYEYIKKRGFSSEAILAAINNEEGSSQVLRDLVEDAVGSTGIAGWNNKQALDAAYQYARQGLWSAVGQDESQLVNSWRAQQKAQQDFQRDQMKPIPMVGPNGKPNGDYYSPKLGMIVDKDGNPKADASGNLSRVGTSGKALITPEEKQEVKKVEEKLKQKEKEAKYGYSPQPIIADKASWGSSWNANFQEGDNTGIFNWFDLQRQTRDWGADARMPARDRVSTVAWADMDADAKSTIIKKAKEAAKKAGMTEAQFDFDPEDYNFYDASQHGTALTLGNRLAGYVAIPKDQDPYVEKIDSGYSQETLQSLLDAGYIDSQGNVLRDFDVYSVPSTTKGTYVQYIK